MIANSTKNFHIFKTDQQTNYRPGGNLITVSLSELCSGETATKKSYELRHSSTPEQIYCVYLTAFPLTLLSFV